MSWQQLVNQTPATGSIAMWNVVSTLIAAGWTKPADSDGTTYSSSGTRVTGGGSGAQGLGNTSAWVRLRDPAGVREITIQRGSTDLVWRVKYSRLAKFSGGSPGATQTPQATDQQIRWGGGTDASPTYTSMFGANGTYRQHVRAQNAAPYQWLHVCYASGSNPNSCFFMDPMVAGTYPVQDADPLVIHVDTVMTTTTGLSEESSGPKGFLAAGLAGEGFVVIPMCRYTTYAGGAQLVFPMNAGSNAHNTLDDEAPVMYARRAGLTAPTGYKGMSSLFRWPGSTRTTSDTLGAKTRIVLGEVTAEWDGSTTPLS